MNNRAFGIRWMAMVGVVLTWIVIIGVIVDIVKG